ncbi:hypothetical protein G6F46_009445 [Rhizopus delemar]|uniref:Uncharacterized protein n=2 Tax=Rhizopus TaxID=4842 RepID=A0A9P6ZDJ4_9FUNG|nr:hypothetical protein G6F55_009859 [Rhizopus delemar]KAG1535705.1 hypothetical protein G6F51_011387 [Rhizopus arrhizus]KAG1488496.1 hypothetical protein G6F54_012048 [Rhizopus delemar]KAG1517570.1 hypothetical protein G6F53_001257 [Rhizopus delemar]KAG1519598.1 hypothetical protein G6F52_008464 [Rhizopus delemar]
MVATASRPTRTSSYGVQTTSQYDPSPTLMISNVSTSPSIKSPVLRIDRPILKGTVIGTTFLDVASMQNKEQFFQDLKNGCNDNERLWSFEDKIICSTGIAIPSLFTKLIGYPSFSSDADNLQISFSNLPREYCRKDDGLNQLRTDMITNLVPYGTALDSGIISGSQHIILVLEDVKQPV